MSAKNDFMIFDEDKINMLESSSYFLAEERLKGVSDGIADPKLHNKLYHQVSVLAYVIGEILKDAGYDATDENPEQLKANIKKVFNL